MPVCPCGCGEETKGKFRPGHDQELRKQLEEKVGGLRLLARLVTAGEMYVQGKMGLEDLGAWSGWFSKKSSRLNGKQPP